jgi:hypothetical protein
MKARLETSPLSSSPQEGGKKIAGSFRYAELEHVGARHHTAEVGPVLLTRPNWLQW